MIDISPIVVEAIEKGVNDVGKFEAGQCSDTQKSLAKITQVLQMTGLLLQLLFGGFIVSTTFWSDKATSQDANFGRYQITPEDVTRAMKRNPKVNTALICIGEGAEAAWYVLPRSSSS